MKLRKILSCLLFFLTSLQLANAQYSNSEGILSPRHDLSLQKYRTEYFLNDDGKLSLAKLNKLKIFLLEQKRLLENSARLNKKVELIEEHDSDADKASKAGKKAIDEEAETLAPILFALEYTEDLLKNSSSYSEKVVHEKVETALLWLAAGYTIYPVGVFTKVVDKAKNLIENFFEYDKNDLNELQASNLLSDGAFASQEKLKKLIQSGKDISKLNPPSSSIWQNNEVEKYNPESEIYFGQKLFPDQKIQVPVFYYSRMGSGTIKLKASWIDDSDLDSKGKPKKKNMTLRVGVEAYTNSVVNHFARIIGYPATPTSFRAKVKLNLGETSFEKFLTQWKRAHELEQGSAITHIERIPGENAIYLKNVNLEAYPEDDQYRKIGPFRMGYNGFRNRREYRAMVLYNSLISLQDHFDYQSRVDGYKNDITKEWKPLFFIADTGSALGLPALLGNVGTVNEFTWKFTKNWNNKVHLFWFSVFDPRTWEDTTYSDVKWLARRMARISSAQIDTIMRLSGFPKPAQALFAEKFKSRINQMIIDFDLNNEGFNLHSVKPISELVGMYPQYIDSKGFLKQNAQEFPGNTLPILGNNFTPYQRIVVSSLNAIQNKLLSLSQDKLSSLGNKTYDLGQYKSEHGILFDAKRDVSVNVEGGPGQKRYLLKDTFSFSIPIGFNNDKLTTPLAFYYTYSFSYFHSVTTMEETLKKRFFALINPFDLDRIKRNLKTGEQLIVTHGKGASVGSVKVKLTDDLKFEAALFNASADRVKTIYFAKPSEDILEIAVDALSQKAFRNGIELKAVATLGAYIGKESSNSRYRLYRLDLLNETLSKKESLNKAFENALIYNNFESLNSQVTPLKLDENAKRRFFKLSLIFWNLFSRSSVHEIQANDQFAYVATESDSQDRAFDRLWNDKIDPKAAKPVLNYLGNFWNEGEAMELNFEGKADSDLTDFSDAQFKINFSKVDNYCTRQEFENDFKKYFNSRSGQPSYIQFNMPPGLDVYPELIGQMGWQINSQALRQIIIAATDWNNLLHLLPTRPANNKTPIQDPREVVSYRAQKALKPLEKNLPLSDRRKKLKEKAQDILFVVKSMIGEKGERVSQLRRFISDKDIWVLTSIEEMLDLSNPAFNTRKGDRYYAPEIGEFQGHTFMELFKRQNLIKPVLQQ